MPELDNIYVISSLEAHVVFLMDTTSASCTAVSAYSMLWGRELTSSTKLRFFHLLTVFNDTLCRSAKTVFGKFDLFISRRMCVYLSSHLHDRTVA